MLKVYLADISNLDIEQDMSLFSDYRKHKIERINNPLKRKQSVGAELLLMHAVKEAVPDFSFPFSIKCGEKGKPEFSDLPLFFSLSHSGIYSACVVSDNAVGLDIEFEQQNNEKIAERFFLKHEKERISLAADKSSAFSKIWTAKESALKLLGTGLSKRLSSVGVFDDYVLSEPEGMRINVRWFESGKLCLALCAKALPERIHIEKIKLS